ncbi:MAG: aromatic ring-hydroxylating dioxygenase subunit alpha [Rhizobiales bacterium]|nr:aromatic ring-hydroxylating dioxygenase subunit alpha [Hyphomicrobiales bacterium]
MTYAGYSQALEPPGYDEELAKVGPGTPCGEFFRRYWHPVAIVADVGELPSAVRILGEDLVLFRTSGGEFGLVHKQCPHRRASLEFGKCEARGIRCCYHGWLFAPDGEILETPGEAGDAEPAIEVRKRTRLGAYPVREYGGLVFAYLGPPGEQPPFSEFDASYVPGITMRNYRINYSCNWLQVLDAIMDPIHTSFLHSQNAGAQFSEGMAEIGELEIFERGLQFVGSNTRRVDDYVWVRVNELILPNFTQAGAAFQADGTRSHYFGRSSFTRWVVPVDDSHCVALAWANFGDRGDPIEYNTQEGCEMIEQGEIVDRPWEERQRRPADAEAVEGMGPISAHKGENLMPTDRGVSLYRRRIRRLVRDLQDGKPVPRQQQIDGQPVRTYGQDSVMKMPAKPGIDDRRFLKQLGRDVMNMQFEAEPKPLDERDATIIEALKQIEASAQ